MKSIVISKYHPKTHSGVGTILNGSHLGDIHLMEAIMETLICAQVSIKKSK
jgi:predicted LPLAT superfamily acyltransferase